MQYFSEIAPTYSECIRKIQEKFGPDIELVTRKNIQKSGFLGLFPKDMVEVTFFITRNPARAPLSPVAAPIRRELNPEEEKQKILNNNIAPAMQQMLKEMQSLQAKLDEKFSGTNTDSEHETIQKIRLQLENNDFSVSFQKQICDRMKRDFSLDELDDFEAVQARVVDWIGESFQIYREDRFQVKPRVMVLVGPTGVGKTTTIAKLAAMYYKNATKSGKKISVRLVTIDCYRIAAKEQIEKYAEIMQMPMSAVSTFEDLHKTIALCGEDVDLVLVDTIGKSPRDFMQLAEMQALLAACGSTADVHLALSATTKYSDMKEILQQFEPFRYRSVLLTKLDETARVGNIISALSERNKSLSFITDGQKVPQDIHEASVSRLLMNLDGFRIDRRRVDERFSKSAAGK